MNFKFNIKLLLITSLFIALNSCEKIDSETEQTIEDPITPETEVVESSVECSGTITVTINGSTEVVNNTGKAVIIKSNGECEDGYSNYPNTVIVLDEDFDFFGLGLHVVAISDGIPGFAFGTNDDTSAGDDLTHWKQLFPFEALFSDIDFNYSFSFAEDIEFTFTEYGTEIGDEIGASFEGNFINNLDGSTVPFSTEFCVPVTDICN